MQGISYHKIIISNPTKTKFTERMIIAMQRNRLTEDVNIYMFFIFLKVSTSALAINTVVLTSVITSSGALISGSTG